MTISLSVPERSDPFDVKILVSSRAPLAQPWSLIPLIKVPVIKVKS